MPLLGSTTLIVLAVTAGITLLVGLWRPFLMLAVLVLGVPFRDFITRWLNVNTELSIRTVNALGRWWFALVLALGLVLVIRFLRGRRSFLDRLDLGWPDWLFIAAVAVAVLSTALAPNKSAAFLSLRGYLQPMAVYVLARVFLPSRGEAKLLLIGLLLVGVAMAAFGLWQGVMWEEADFRANGYVRQDGTLVTPPTRILGQIYIRPASTVSGPNEFGLDMVILFAVGLLMAVQRSGPVRWVGLALALLFTAGLLATYSRSSLLGYIAAWLGIIWLQRGWLRRTVGQAPTRQVLVLGLLFAGLLVVIASGLVLTGFYDYLTRTVSRLPQTYHYVDTVEAIQFLAANPFGVGMGMVEPKGALALIQTGGTYHVEGSLLQIAMEMSVLGLAVWLVFWAVALARTARDFRRLEDPVLRIFTGAAFAGWLGAFVAFVFLPLMQSISLMVWLWFLLGVAVSADRIEAAWLERSEEMRGRLSQVA